MNIGLEIKNLRNLKEFSIELALEKDIYAITGENGIGKSTILLVLSKLVYDGALTNYFRNDGNSETSIKFNLSGKENIWLKRLNWRRMQPNDENLIKLDGHIEQSLIFGSRFDDAHKSMLKNIKKIGRNQDLIPADDFIVEHLGIILKNNKSFYNQLSKISTKAKAKEYGFSGYPYFFEKDNKIISQLFMSSGEFLLIGLLHFIHTTIKRKQTRKILKRSFLLIDEIDLCLHPSAQKRLIGFLRDILKEHNFCIYFSTHSIPIINEIKPNNIYYLKRYGTDCIDSINPCYPAYITQSLYINEKFDFIICVEDNLAKNLVEIILQDKNLKSSKLIKILPCGGWEKTLELQEEFQASKLADQTTKFISILDGDIQDECNKRSKFKNLEKNFLPIKSIEKYLHKQLIEQLDTNFYNRLGDTYFSTTSIDNIVNDYKNKDKDKDKDKKELFKILSKYANNQNIDFEKEICTFIYNYQKSDFERLAGHLKNFLS